MDISHEWERNSAGRASAILARPLCTAAQIADFGLSRNTGGKDYYRRTAASAPIPVRWMAPETLTHDVSTLSSDCWSFGVFMWEVFTFGERPYAGMQNKEVHAAPRLCGAVLVCRRAFCISAGSAIH